MLRAGVENSVSSAALRNSFIYTARARNSGKGELNIPKKIAFLMGDNGIILELTQPLIIHGERPPMNLLIFPKVLSKKKQSKAAGGRFFKK